MPIQLNPTAIAANAATMAIAAIEDRVGLYGVE
jgi:hypothetical protein